MHLPPANVPFPVEVPFRTVADLYKLPSWLHGEWQQDYFCLDDTLESYLSCRLHELRHHADYCRCVLRDDEGGLEPSLWQVFHLIAKDKPQLVELHDDGVTLKALGISLSKTLSLSRHEAIFPELAAACYEHLDKQEGLYRLADCLSLAVQEDLVIMRSDAEGDKAECLLVAMPSHWTHRKNSVGTLPRFINL